jgi:tripartite-type tricarboxylate transporter receptor subunit TctC
MFYEPQKNDHGLRFAPFKSCVVPRPIAWISTGKMRLGCARIAAPTLVLSMFILNAYAEDYPRRPIRLVQPATAGGFSDSLSRVIANSVSARLGQSVVIENRPGAMNMIANKSVSRSDPDGYTLLYGSIDMTMAPSLRKDASTFEAARDLTPVAMVASVAGVYVVNPKLPVNSLAELAAYAKTKPGQVRNAINGIGGSLHLTTKLFEIKTGTELSHIPYRGTSEAMLAVISGEVEMGAFSLSMGSSNRDRVRVLAQTGPSRHPTLADIPTTAEAGLPDVGVTYWFGIFAPPQTPTPIIDRLAHDLKATLGEQDLQQKLWTMGAIVDYLPPEEFAKYVTAEQQKWGSLIPAMGFKPE